MNPFMSAFGKGDGVKASASMVDDLGRTCKVQLEAVPTDFDDDNEWVNRAATGGIRQSITRPTVKGDVHKRKRTFSESGIQSKAAAASVAFVIGATVPAPKKARDTVPAPAGA